MNAHPMLEERGGAPHSKQSLRLWLRLLTCSTVIEKRIRQKLTETYFTTLPRFDVLAALDRHPDGLSMGDISRWLLVSSGNVTSLVARLVVDGLVERTPEVGDRRILRVRLTPDGAAAFAEMAAAHESWIDEMMRDVDEADFKLMLEALDRLGSSVEGNPI